MSFLSPLEALADKFNIINFNIRELLFKLSLWNTTESDSVLITLKTQDAPYFETHKIPSMKFIANNGKKTNWGNFKPEGTKYWGNTITAIDHITENGTYFIPIDTLSSPKTHFMEYTGIGVESDVVISLLNSGSDIGSILEFVLVINPDFSNITGKYFVYFIDNANNNILLKIGSEDLVNLIENEAVSGGRVYPKKFKISFQYVLKPEDINASWVIFDLYQFPRYEYNSNTASTVPINY